MEMSAFASALLVDDNCASKILHFVYQSDE